MRNACRVAVALCLLIFMVSGLMFAQSDLGTISGFVKDPSGATVANAKITVRNNRGVERVAATNDSGYYAITNIPAGLYTIVVEAPGFQRYESRDNKLDPSAVLAIDVALTVGSANETVEGFSFVRAVANRVRLGPETRHSRADRFAGDQRTEPYFHG